MSRRDISEQNGGRRTRGVPREIPCRCMRGSGCAFRRARPRSPAPQDSRSPRPPRPPGEGDSVPESAAGRTADRWREPPLDQRRGRGRPDHRRSSAASWCTSCPSRPAGWRRWPPRLRPARPRPAPRSCRRRCRSMTACSAKSSSSCRSAPPASCGRSTNSPLSATASRAGAELTPVSICNCARSPPRFRPAVSVNTSFGPVVKLFRI